MSVHVKTDGDSFASLEFDRILVEFSKDGDSPNCPNSWTWHMWFDGCAIDGTCDEMSLSASVRDATGSIIGCIQELAAMRDFLAAYGVFGEVVEEPDYLCDMCANGCDERRTIRVGQSAYDVCEKWQEVEEWA